MRAAALAGLAVGARCAAAAELPPLLLPKLLPLLLPLLLLPLPPFLPPLPIAGMLKRSWRAGTHTQ